MNKSTQNTTTHIRDESPSRAPSGLKKFVQRIPLDKRGFTFQFI